MIDSLKGKICLITGASKGIGNAAATELARLGATVVIVCRTEESGRVTASEIRATTGSQSVDFFAADLSSQTVIRKLADDFCSKYSELHVLINNAGVYLDRRSESPEGIETTFAVNHLAYFMLTHLLLDRLKAGSRIINVSSEAHRAAQLDFEYLQGEKKYSGFGAYKLSKLCNLLFTHELSRRLQGSGVTANAMHPGVVATGIFRNAPLPVRGLVKLMALNPTRGAETVVFLATSPDVSGVSGKYFYKKVETTPSSLSMDETAARKLWDISMKLTGLDSAL